MPIGYIELMVSDVSPARLLRAGKAGFLTLNSISCFKNTAPYFVYVSSNYFSLDIQPYLPSESLSV